MRLLCAFLLVSSAFLAQAIEGTVADSFTGAPLSGVTVGIENTQVDTATKQPRLEKDVRLYRDGKPVLTDQPAPLTATSADDPKRLLLDGTLRLDEQFAAGDYVLQVIVTDKLASEKDNTAAQWIDFEVAP